MCVRVCRYLLFFFFPAPPPPVSLPSPPPPPSPLAGLFFGIRGLGGGGGGGRGGREPLSHARSRGRTIRIYPKKKINELPSPSSNFKMEVKRGLRSKSQGMRLSRTTISSPDAMVSQRPNSTPPLPCNRGTEGDVEEDNHEKDNENIGQDLWLSR